GYYHRNNLPIIYLEGSCIQCRDDSDRELTFHQEANFMYLTGAHNLPEATRKKKRRGRREERVLLSMRARSRRYYLFPPIDPAHVMWSGLPETREQIHGRLKDLSAVKYKNELASYLKNTIPTTHTTTPTPTPTILSLATTSTTNTISDQFTISYNDSKLLAAIREARVIKTEQEIMIVIVEDLKCKHMSPFLNLTIIMWLSIGYGVHAGTLHYTSNDAKIPSDFDGVLLVDAGCESFGYASDITRTFPIGNRGKFIDEARDIYQIVLDMQEAALSTIKAGIEWEEIQVLMHKVAAKGLIKLGILKNLTVDESYENGHVIPFFPHGVGHFLGLDTHDVSGLPNGKGAHPTLKYLRLQRKLEAGNVVTVEPGLYFNQFLLDPVKGSDHINHEVLVSISNVVVTQTGCVNLTKVVKTVDEIEKLTSY
ncbi:hypothetical protein PSHT_11361, partial [Puccinia striiformis]